MRYKRVGLFFILLIVFFTGHADSRADENLRMYRGTPEHRGTFFTQAPLNQKMRPHWRYWHINHGIHTASKSSPVAGQHMIFVGSDTGVFYALDQSSGAVVWQFKARVCKNGIHSSPALDTQRIYVGAYDGYLYALARKDGRLVWESKLGDFIGSSPTVVDDRIYVGVEQDSGGGFLASINKDNGHLIFRTQNLLGHPHSTPTVSLRQRLVFIGANSGFLYAFDADRGELRWKYKTGGAIKSTAALADGNLYFTSWDKHLYALDSASGELKWKFRTGRKAMSSPAVDVSAGMVYVGSHDGFCYGLRLRDGRKMWQYATGNIIMSSPIIVNMKPSNRRAVIIGSHDCYLYVLDAAQGREIAAYRANAPISSVPLVADGMLIFSSDRDLYAFK